MKQTSEDIATLLGADSSLALTYGDDLYVNFEPHDPPNCVTIYDIPGSGIKDAFNRTRVLQYPSVQIRVRNIYQTDGYTLAYNILDVLDRIANQIIGSAYYLSIRCTSGPETMNWDQSERIRIVQNFDITRTKK